jgi:hypothetical protein
VSQIVNIYPFCLLSIPLKSTMLTANSPPFCILVLPQERPRSTLRERENDRQQWTHCRACGRCYVNSCTSPSWCCSHNTLPSCCSGGIDGYASAPPSRSWDQPRHSCQCESNARWKMILKFERCIMGNDGKRDDWTYVDTQG